jgi:hypothetical protein
MTICYIASNAVAFYSDYLMSPSLSLRFSSLLLLLSSFAPDLLPARFALLDWPAMRQLDRRIPLAMPTHTMPGECDAELGIVAASDVGKPMAKIPRDGRFEFYLTAPRDVLRVHPGD